VDEGKGATFRADGFAAERFAIAAVALCGMTGPDSLPSVSAERRVGVMGRDKVREGEGPGASLRERWADLGGVRGASIVCT
jgi:hypothetical protein